MANEITQIPVMTDVPNFIERVELEGTIYNLEFRYNERQELWHMDIRDANDVDLLVGVPLLGGLPLTSRFVGRIEGLPPGSFLCVNESGDPETPSYLSFGNGVNLFYQASE